MPVPSLCSKDSAQGLLHSLQVGPASQLASEKEWVGLLHEGQQQRVLLNKNSNPREEELLYFSHLIHPQTISE